MKEHKKLYKAGKLWLTATIALVAGGIMLTSTASADTTTPAQQEQTSQVTPAPVASVTTQQQFAAANDQGANAACLDSVKVAPATEQNSVHLVATGWHAADASQDNPYRYAILYDNTANQEVARVKVAGEDVINRPDVQKVYANVANSQKSGFQASFNIPVTKLTNSLSLVSRYSNDAKNGEGQHTDVWLPIHIDMNNYGYLDGVEVNDNQVHVHGWHATNQAITRSHHFIIAFDKTQNREIARQEIKDNNVRNDVAKAYPSVFNANQSGFDVNFNLNPAFVNDEVQFISRWSGATDGNSDYADDWFTPQRLFNDQANRASLDQFGEKDGQMTIAGWHAANQAYGKEYHYIIVIDKTTGKEVARQRVTTGQSRPDVAKVFPQIVNAANSGFSVTIPYNKDWDGHNLQVVSRWTDDQAGNGQNTVDYWFTPTILAGQPAQPSQPVQPSQPSQPSQATNDQGYLDKWLVVNPGMHPGTIIFCAKGWHVTNNLKHYRRFVLLDNTTNQVVTSFMNNGDHPIDGAIDQYGDNRPDIAAKYGQYRNAAKSGFNIQAYWTNPQFGHDYTLVSQYADDENGTNASEVRFHLGVITQANLGTEQDFEQF